MGPMLFLTVELVKVKQFKERASPALSFMQSYAHFVLQQQTFHLAICHCSSSSRGGSLTIGLGLDYAIQLS